MMIEMIDIIYNKMCFIQKNKYNIIENIIFTYLICDNIV